MVATVAAASEPIALGLALEIRARHIIQQELIVEIEQRSQALLEVGLQGLLVRQQTVERAVQPVIVDALGRHAQKIVQRRAAIPILGNVQLARRLAQARNHQDRRDRRPRRPLAAFDQTVLAETIESKGAPQPPAQPHVAKTAGALQADMVQPHCNRFAPSGRRLKQLVLLFPPGDPQGQSAGPRPSLPVELAKLRHRLLHHSAAATHRAHQTPVAVRLAVLANRRVA